MRIENGKAGNHQLIFNGYILNPLSIPGVYERIAARIVSKHMPKLSMWLVMPCWNTESFRVLQIIKSAHCTMTIETKNAV